MDDSKIWGDPEQMGIFKLDDAQITAFEVGVSFAPHVPRFYRRTYLLGLAFGPLIGAIAGLFDYDAKVWCWSKGGGFKAVVLTKRRLAE